MPGMQRHTLFLKMHDENKKLIEQLEIDGDEERREHLTSIECAWEQRVHWAACHSFYCGYRAAVKVLTAVDGVNAFDMIPHTLLLEYHLGYTKSYDQTEQQHIDRYGQAAKAPAFDAGTVGSNPTIPTMIRYSRG